MDEPASPAPETLTDQSRAPARPKPKPLTPFQKKVYAVLALLGLILCGVTFYLSDSSLPGFVIGGMAGAGGSLLAIGGMMLFHRPDR